MRDIYRYFSPRNSQPYVKRFSSGSGMVTLSEYTNPGVKNFSEPDPSAGGEVSAQIENLQDQINELTATVGRLSEIMTNLKAYNADTSQAEGEPQPQETEAQPEAEQTQENTEALGAEVPSNTGTYTQVPEDEIVSQFSSRSENSAVLIPSLGNLDTFKVLFK